MFQTTATPYVAQIRLPVTAPATDMYGKLWNFASSEEDGHKIFTQHMSKSIWAAGDWR